MASHGTKAAPKESGAKKSHKSRISKWYKSEDTKTHFRRRRLAKQNPTKLRKSIKPGSVLILLAGRFRGKRVVFLKQLKSGLLLVTGPHKLNGVPLKRVNQSYVQPTSTKVDISSADVSKIEDDYFKRVAKTRSKNQYGFFKTKPEVNISCRKFAKTKYFNFTK
jgi:large subunit ribosomal protein L6e